MTGNHRWPPADEAVEAAPAPRGRGLVTILVPAKDEESGIGRTLRALPLATLRAQGFDAEVLVLDGSSRDATARIAQSWGARVLRQGAPGKGVAVRGALGWVRGEYVVMIDADATYAADALPALVDALVSGEADVVMGSRRRGWRAPGAMSPANRIGNALLSGAASVLYARRVTDLCTGLWGFRASALRSLPLEARGFELEAELFARAARAGLRIREVPVDYLPRHGPTKLRRVRDGARIGVTLLRARFLRARGGPAPTLAPLPAPAAGPGAEPAPRAHRSTAPGREPSPGAAEAEA